MTKQTPELMTSEKFVSQFIAHNKKGASLAATLRLVVSRDNVGWIEEVAQGLAESDKTRLDRLAKQYAAKVQEYRENHKELDAAGKVTQPAPSVALKAVLQSERVQFPQDLNAFRIALKRACESEDKEPVTTKADKKGKQKVVKAKGSKKTTDKAAAALQDFFNTFRKEPTDANKAALVKQLDLYQKAKAKKA